MTDLFWMPFPGDWTRERVWRDYEQRNPRLVQRARRGLSRTLPDSKLFQQNFFQHQLGMDFVMRKGRWRLLEAGYVLDGLPAVAEYTKRLLDRDASLRALTELGAAFMFERLGFGVTRFGDDGPDWIATNARASFGVEVKCPDMSDVAKVYCRFTARALFTTAVLGRTDVELMPEKQAADSAIIGSWLDDDRVDALVLDAVDELEAGRSTSTFGDLRTTEWPMAGCIASPAAVEESRLRDHMMEAAGQLRHAARPGIIVLDSTLDSGLMFRCCAVRSILHEAKRESWANDIAAVILVRPTLPGFVVTVVAGARFAEFVHSRARVRVCENDHYHVETFHRVGCLPESNPQLCLASSN